MTIYIANPLHPDIVFRAERTARIAGIFDALRFDDERLALPIGPRSVLHPLGYNKHLPRSDLNTAVSKVDMQDPAEHNEHLVGIAVLMPNELASRLEELELVLVEFSDDPGGPCLVEAGEFLSKVDRAVGHNARSLARSLPEDFQWCMLPPMARGGLIAALVCALGACGPADLRLPLPTGLPTTGALFVVVQTPDAAPSIRVDHADTRRLLSVDIDPAGPVTVTVLHTERTLEELDLSPGPVPTVELERCGAQGLPAQSGLRSLEVSDGVASSWSTLTSLPSQLRSLRIDGPCPCSSFNVAQTIRSDHLVTAYFARDDGSVLLMNGGGFERLSPAGQLSPVVTSTQIPSANIRTVAQDSDGSIFLGTSNRLWWGSPAGGFAVARSFADDNLLQMAGGLGPDGYELFALTELGRLIQLRPGPETEILPPATAIVDPSQPGRIAWLGTQHVVVMQAATADLAWVRDGEEYRRVSVPVETGGLFRLSAIPGLGAVAITRNNRVLYFPDSGLRELKTAPPMAETRILLEFPGGFVYAGDSGYIQQYHQDSGFCPLQMLTGLPRILGLSVLGDRWLVLGPGSSGGTLLRIIEPRPIE